MIIGLRTVFACHRETSNLLVKCEIGSRIRILESFYAVSIDSNRDYCRNGFVENDCKSYTNLQNVCNGKVTCTVHLFQEFISTCFSDSDYLSVLYECIPGISFLYLSILLLRSLIFLWYTETRIHNICSNVEEYTSWGTLHTTDYPKPYGTNENCWCKLTSKENQRIVLSVITFQLFPFDPTCSEAGLYLQSDRKKNKECTLLQQGHYYISSSSNLFLNFYSKSPTVRGGFWLIFEGK